MVISATNSANSVGQGPDKVAANAKTDDATALDSEENRNKAVDLSKIDGPELKFTKLRTVADIESLSISDNDQMPVVVIAVNSNHYEKVVSNIEEIKARQGKIIAVVTEGDTTVRNLADFIMEVPKTPETLSPLVTTIPLQLLAYHIAVMLGKNVDQPRNLAKSVTVE